MGKKQKKKELPLSLILKFNSYKHAMDITQVIKYLLYHMDNTLSNDSDDIYIMIALSFNAPD